MYGSMVDIQSATAEIRRGKKEEETTGQKYNKWPALLHRAAIIICTSLQTDNHISTLSLNFLQAGCFL